jgi:hypothetical protein
MLHRNLLTPFSGSFYPDDRSRREYSSKALEASYRLYGTTHMTVTLMVTAMRTSNLNQVMSILVRMANSSHQLQIHLPITSNLLNTRSFESWLPPNFW